MLTVTCEEVTSASIKGSKARVLLIGCKITDSHYHVLSVTSDGGSNITEKAKQISGTLPGGIYVLGVAMDTNPKQLKTQLNLVRGLLASVKKKSRGGGGRDQSLLIYYSQESKKLRCLSVDVDDPQSVLQLPGSEVKVTQKELLVGHTYLSFSMEQVIEIKGRDASSTGLSGVLNDTLKQCIGSLRDAVAVSDGGSIPKNDDCVSEYVHGNNSIEVKFNWKNNVSGVDSPFIIRDGLNVKVEDGLHCKAYVHAQAKWQQLVELLKEDAIKTLTIRKEAILAELVGDGEQEESEEGEKRKSWKTFKLMFPRRIWFKDDSKKYELCEIVFPEENEEEAKENLKEIWGEGIILTLSHGDDENRNGEEFKPISNITKSQIDSKPNQNSDGKPSNLTYYLLAIIVVLLAIAIVIILL